jgi:enoyl-CoA hydratase
MEYETLLYEAKNQVGWITLNRPAAMNALNVAMIRELGDCAQKLEADASIRVVVIKGAGDKAFSAGADLKEIAPLGTKGGFDYSRAAHRAFTAIERLGKPVIGCINGLAMGGGAELALACHIRIVSEKAKLSFPEAGLGGIPGMGGTQRLPRLIGKSLGLFYLLTGERISPELGLQSGLYHKVVKDEELMAAAEEMAMGLAKKSPLSLKFIIQAVTSGMDGSQEEGLVIESSLMSAISGSEDKKEGLQAIAEKRAPNFKGE